MNPLGPCVYCGATLESTIAHVCPTHPGGHPPKTFWAGRVRGLDEVERCDFCGNPIARDVTHSCRGKRLAIGQSFECPECGHEVMSGGVCPSCTKADPPGADPITRRHYYQFPGGVEAADIAEHLPFNLGSVVKYAARAGRKENADAIDDCEKGIDFFRREIRRLRRTK